MGKWFKWTMILFGSFLALLVLAVLLIPALVDIETYTPAIEQKASQALGLDVHLTGDMALSLFPWVGVSLSGLSVDNPPEFTHEKLLSIPSFEVRIKLLPLLSKDIQVKRFVLQQPRIILEKNASGKGNWEYLGGPPPPVRETSSDPQPEAPPTELPIDTLAVDDFSVTGGSVLWVDAAGEMEKEISNLNLRVTDVTLEDPVPILFSAVFDGKPVSIEGQIGPIRTEAVPVDLDLSALDILNIGLKGKVRNPTTRPGIDVTLRIEPFSPRKVLSALHRPFPVETSDPEALSRLGFQGKISADSASLSISDGTLSLDRSTMTFSAALKNPEAPEIRFDTRLDAIDLDRYLPPPSKFPEDTRPPETEPPGRPATVDIDPLRKLSVNGHAQIGTLKAAGAEIQNIDVKIIGEKGIFRLDPLTLNLYKGKIAATGLADLRREAPSSKLDLKIEGLQARPLLQDVMEMDLLEGTARAEISLNMEGLDPDQMKRTLDGEGVFLFNDGSVKGINLTAMVRNVDTAFSILGLKEGGSAPSPKPGENQNRTDFSELKMAFQIVDGLVTIPEATLTSPFIRAAVSGRADLVSENLDLRITPKFVATAKGQGDTEKRTGYLVPVVVGGTFSFPTFRPDVNAMIKMVPKETVTEILKDPEKGIDTFVQQKKDELRDVLNIGPEKEKATSAEESPATPRPKEEDAPKSTQKQVGDFLKKLPFGD